MKYYFYILFSEKLDKFYIGYSENPNERLKKHNVKHKGFTGQTNDWKILYTEEFDTKKKAYSRERQVKAWKSRELVEKLIKKGSEHPDFTSGGS